MSFEGTSSNNTEFDTKIKSIHSGQDSGCLTIEHANFEKIYETYWESLYAIGLNRIKSKSDVEDMVQEIFVELWNRKEVPVNTSLKGYLYTSMKYKIIDYYRKAKIEEISLDQAGSQHAHAVKADQVLSFNELFDRLTEGIDKLPDKCRLIFKLSREEGLSSAEIADRLQLSKRTVETQIYKSLKALKSNLEDYALMLKIFFS